MTNGSDADRAGRGSDVLLAGRGERRDLVQVLLGSVIVVIVYFLLPLDRDFGVLLGIGAFLAMVVGLLPMTVRRARRVLVSPTPFIEALKSIALLYTMVVVGFAMAYLLLATQADDQMHGIETHIDALYFSVVTNATVGYGDMVPVGQLSRAVVMVHIVLGLLTLGFAARLLTVVLQRRRGELEQSLGGPGGGT
jgi:voltage-gated potassium channel Kch